jgi:hypothetical protein
MRFAHEVNHAGVVVAKLGKHIAGRDELGIIIR